MEIKKIGKSSIAVNLILDYLKKNDLLNESSKKILSINYLNPISFEDEIYISNAFNMDNYIIVIENFTNSKKLEQAFITSEKAINIIIPSLSGRHQDVLIINNEIKSAIRLNSLESVSDQIQLDEENIIQIERKNSSNELVKIDHLISHEDVFKDIFTWINLKTKNIIKNNDEQQLVNASLMRGSVTILRSDYLTSNNHTKASLYSSYDIELAAVISPKKNKIVKITSVNSYVSITNGLTKDNKNDRGDGTFEGRMILIPGNHRTFNKEEVQLPQGWRIIKISPETKNNDNSYTRTTGWSIGAEGGGEMGKDPKIAAKLSVSYSDSTAYSESFKDFTAINSSNSAYLDWSYLYTKVHKNWKDIFSTFLCDIESFPDLAKSTMYMKNEVVFEAPASENSIQDFQTYIHHQTLYAHSHMNWYGVIKYGINYEINREGYDWNQFSINMNTVIFPSE